jgi:hypothetical protein
LAGVGGRTVAEAKQNISYAEAAKWSAYLKEHGWISQPAGIRNLISHLEFYSAQVAWSVFKAAGAKDIKISDFMPSSSSSDEEDVATLDDFMSILKSAKIKK